MPLYESVVIARQDISAAQVDTVADELTKIIEENGGSVAKREHWGLRSLTYRIKKNRKGHYVLFNINAPAAALSELERRMRLNEDILRYLSIRVDEHEEGQSSILTNKGRPPGRREGALILAGADRLVTITHAAMHQHQHLVQKEQANGYGSQTFLPSSQKLPVHWVQCAEDRL